MSMRLDSRPPSPATPLADQHSASQHPLNQQSQAGSHSFAPALQNSAIHFNSPSGQAAPGNQLPANNAAAGAAASGQATLVEGLQTLLRALLQMLLSRSDSGAGAANANPGAGQSGTAQEGAGIHGSGDLGSAATQAGPENASTPTEPSPTGASSTSPSAAAISTHPTSPPFNANGLGGANTVPDRIASPEAATRMINDVKNAGGGTLRIQMSHDQINDPAQIAKLDALVKEGDKQGVKVQFTFRDNANGGGGNVLSGDKLQQAAEDMKSVVSRFAGNPSFAVDTFNEGGTSATQGWADMQSTLIKSARDAGYKGDIVVEDSNWGGGLTAGGESGLVKYADQLKAANGQGNGAMIGSIHEYASGADASKRLSGEIDALSAAGYGVQIGEVGNANWTGGDSFEQRDGAVQAVKDNMAKLKSLDATVLPWMDQFVDGKISHTVGFSKDDQLT